MILFCLDFSSQPSKIEKIIINFVFVSVRNRMLLQHYLNDLAKQNVNQIMKITVVAISLLLLVANLYVYVNDFPQITHLCLIVIPEETICRLVP